jgi:hypothetical protein
MSSTADAAWHRSMYQTPGSYDYERHKLRHTKGTFERRKAIAQHSIRNAVHAGKLDKAKKCCVTGCECDKVEFHHIDLTYNPINDLVGIWICRRHHRLSHRAPWGFARESYSYV